MQGNNVLDFTRLEVREILSHLNLRTVDSDVLMKLQQAANATSSAVLVGAGPSYPPPHVPPYVPTTAPLSLVESISAAALEPDIPPYIPLVLSADVLAKTRVPAPTEEDPQATRSATQADVDEVNAIKEQAHFTEWRARKAYRVNTNERDVVNAAFDAPERERGFDPNLEVVAVGGTNKYGDECVGLGANGESIFRCASGHGYSQSRSLRSCPTCFTSGTVTEQREVAEDRGAIPGTDGRF